MKVKQLSVFVENRKGNLVPILEHLSRGGVDISALSLADTTDFGVLRLIVDKVDEAQKILSDDGVIVKVTEVLAVVMNDHPGGAAEVLSVLADNHIEVEYMYACAGKTLGKALMIVRVDDPERAEALLRDKGFDDTKANEIYRI
jgi:hypothetical protein